MEISEQSLDVVNNLIKINNDRTAGFEKAATDLESDDNNIVSVFETFAAQSRQYTAELTSLVQQGGGEAVDSTSTTGDLHRIWIDIKSTFTGSSLLAILNECERGEDAAKAAYKEAFDPENELDAALYPVLQLQQEGITEGHDTIKGLIAQIETDDDSSEEKVDDRDTTYDQNETQQTSFSVPTNGYQTQAVFDSPEPATVVGEDETWEDDEDETGTGNSKLMEFFVNELKDLLWAEQELLDTLPEMAEAATSAELKAAFEAHHAETLTHIKRLEQAFAVLGLEPETRKCEAMAGIVDEGDEIINATEEGTAQRDVGLIFAGQKAEHYEIASYGGMIALAKTLGYYEIAELFVLTLDEEKSADAKLTEIAEGQANYDASLEQAED